MSRRGAGVLWGEDVTRHFLTRENLAVLVRSHQCVNDGVSVTHGGCVYTVGRCIDPIEPKFKAPGTKRLKARYDGPLSNFAFNFNLHRYNTVFSASNYCGTSGNMVGSTLTLRNTCRNHLELST